ncbi:MAG TPA: polysaccharide deacetylase family protein [Pyrinomonadaceae bacterium]|nr:polysaccharide deacetylase family protein [Pyrinomonadaceae bacterium]
MTLILIAFVLPLVGGAALISAGAGAVYYATYAVRSQWLGSADWHGRRDTGAVALTFDDGPSDDTEHILDILAEQNTRGTFFMIGRNVERLPRTARRVAACGHEIGNHSYSHPIYLYRRRSETHRQLERAQRVITETIGVSPKLARPPCGVRTPAYFAAAQRLSLRTIQWEVAGFDWKRRSAERIALDVLRRSRPGSIILLHDGDSEGKEDRRRTVAALPLIIEGLRERGLHIVPLSQLLGAK